MNKIMTRIKHLFTKQVFKGENDRLDFFVYHFLISLFFILPASTYIKMESAPTDLINFVYLIISTISLFIGTYFLAINIVRRANKTVAPFMKYVGLLALIISQVAGYPLTALYQLVAVILLLLPNHKH